jgi:DNA polymerase sigma
VPNSKIIARRKSLTKVLNMGGIKMTTVSKRVNSENGDIFLKELKDIYKKIGYTDEEANEAIEDFKKECEKYN